MSFITYKITKGLEYHHITSALKEQNIPFIARNHTNTVLPVIDGRGYFGEIQIDAQYKDSVEALISDISLMDLEDAPDEYPETITTKPTKSKSKTNKAWLFLSIYAVLISVFAARQTYIVYKSYDEKNLSFHWSGDATLLYSQYKETNEIINIFKDENYDFNWESIKTYSLNGASYAESIDKDEDGLYERIKYYGRKNEYAGSAVDYNKDGLYEYYEMIFENGDTLILRDENHNGFYDKVK